MVPRLGRSAEAPSHNSSWRAEAPAPPAAGRGRPARTWGSAPRLTVAALIGISLGFGLHAQTLEQAEALWKAHRYEDANVAFRGLNARDPNNAEYKTRWGRL